MAKPLPSNREELKSALQEMRAQGATPDELAQAVKEIKQLRPNVDFTTDVSKLPSSTLGGFAYGAAGQIAEPVVDYAKEKVASMKGRAERGDVLGTLGEVASVPFDIAKTGAKLVGGAAKEISKAGVGLFTNFGKQLMNIPEFVQYVSQGAKELKETGQLSEETQALGEQIDQQSKQLLSDVATVGGTLALPVAPVASGLAYGAVPYLERQIASEAGGQTKGAELGRVAGEMFTGGLLGKLGGPKAQEGLAVVKKELPAAIEKVTPEVFTKDVPTLRAEKIAEGLQEQNVRLKSVDRAFKKNTIQRKVGDESVTITPIDTLGKYNIAPVIEKGSIQMGDYATGTGALGKIKEQVGMLDDQIDTTLKDTGKVVSVDDLEVAAIAKAQADETLKQSGKVSATVKKLEGIFDDFKVSYGDTVPVTEVNGIRKVMNRDFHPDTVDTSRVIGDATRDIVYSSTDDQAVKQLLQQQGELLAAKKYAEVLNGTKVVGGRGGAYIARMLGGLLGASIEEMPVIGGLLGIAGGDIAAKVLQQAQFKSLPTEVKAVLQRSTTAEKIMTKNKASKKVSIPKSITSEKEKVKPPTGFKTAGTAESAFVTSVQDLFQQLRLGRVVKYNIGPVSNKLVAMTEQLGVPVNQYRHIIDNSGVTHALDQHGRSTLPVTQADFDLIPQIVNEFDSVELGHKTPQGLEVLKYKKRFNGTTYYLEEIRTGRKELALKTMYKKPSSTE